LKLYERIEYNELLEKIGEEDEEDEKIENEKNKLVKIKNFLLELPLNQIHIREI
jgi:hypothetical protein